MSPSPFIVAIDERDDARAERDQAERERDELRAAAREMVSAWMSGNSQRQAAAIRRLEDLTGGQQNGS